jgi:phenylacetate-coenzyme A ligase PaaK-like adenylate-forming protein
MILHQGLIKRIFSIQTHSEFKNCALEVFRFQAESNKVYAQWLSLLKCDVGSVKELNQIPFLPIQFFKTQTVLSGEENSSSLTFTSSGTTGQITSKHIVSDVLIYEQSFTKCFELFYGEPKDYCILALLPSYLDRQGSSLVYMANHLIKTSKHPLSNFFLHNLEELKIVIQQLKQTQQKVVLLGVSYALMDLADMSITLTENFTVMETGGMKGKRKELLKSELHQYLKERFKINHIHSEYGMTELLSQAYLRKDAHFDSPPWMQFLIREINHPQHIRADLKTGGINVIDLANINSCSFIATQDLGRLTPNGQLQLMGRFDNSDVRGCNLMVE